MADASGACVYVGEALGRYGFGASHPFGPDRMDAFWAHAQHGGVAERVRVCAPVQAERALIERFHDAAYVDRVQRLSAQGEGFLDAGDTPVVPGIYEAGATVVGSTVDAARRIMTGDCRRAFVPIAGLHHAHRDRASGFCVFNDCGVAIETLRQEFGLRRIAYIDIDAHHGDGVFYAYEADPDLIFADVHQDGRYLFPGTGALGETGAGAARGTKLNLPMEPGSGDKQLHLAWEQIEQFVARGEPEFILLQCGADSLAGDPIAQLNYSPEAHRFAATRLCHLADEFCDGRLLALGGGGYNRVNLARAWTAVLEVLAGPHPGQ